MIKKWPVEGKAIEDDDRNHINSDDVNRSIMIMLIEKRWWANNCFCYPITWSRLRPGRQAVIKENHSIIVMMERLTKSTLFVSVSRSNLETAIENSFLVGWIMKTTQKVGNRRHETTRGWDWIAFVAFQLGFLWSAKGLRIMRDKREFIEVFQWKCAQDMWRPPAKNQISVVQVGIEFPTLVCTSTGNIRQRGRPEKICAANLAKWLWRLRICLA